VVDELERAGLVHRERNSEDKRSFHAVITATLGLVLPAEEAGGTRPAPVRESAGSAPPHRRPRPDGHSTRWSPHPLTAATSGGLKYRVRLL
jgi:hypothetical protein